MFNSGVQHGDSQIQCNTKQESGHVYFESVLPGEVQYHMDSMTICAIRVVQLQDSAIGQSTFKDLGGGAIFC